MQTGSAEVTQTPPEWTNPAETVPSDAPAPAIGTPPGTVDVQQVVRQGSRRAVAAAVVMDRNTGDVLVNQNANRQFYAGSLVKLLVGIDALLRAPSSARVREDVVIMIERSDDAICSELWVANGGGKAIIERMRREIGLKATEPPRTDPGQWGDTLITANDLVHIYDYILTEAPSTVRMAMLKGMANATEYGADRFKQYFGIPSATDNAWAIKQAWTNNPRALSAHSTGLVGGEKAGDWRYIVVLLTEHPADQSYAVATRTVTAAATAISPLLK